MNIRGNVVKITALVCGFGISALLIMKGDTTAGATLAAAIIGYIFKNGVDIYNARKRG